MRMLRSGRQGVGSLARLTPGAFEPPGGRRHSWTKWQRHDPGNHLARDVAAGVKLARSVNSDESSLETICSATRLVWQLKIADVFRTFLLHCSTRRSWPIKRGNGAVFVGATGDAKVVGSRMLRPGN
jgi:hypothetical protein